MRRAASITILAAMLLASCGEGAPSEVVDLSDITSHDLRQILTDQGYMIPGLYDVTGVVDSVDYPVLDGDDDQSRAIGQIIRERLADVAPVTLQLCVGVDTAFDARGPDVKGCTIASFRLEGDAADYIMTCPTLDSGEMATSTLSGSFAENGYILSSKSEVPSTPGPTAETRMATINVRHFGERLGDCEG